MVFERVSDRVKAGLAGIVLLGGSATLSGCGAILTGAAAAVVYDHLEHNRRASQPNNPVTRRHEFIACKTVPEDLNGDGGIDLPTEVYHLASSNFSQEEAIVFVCSPKGMQGRVVTMEINYNGQRKELSPQFIQHEGSFMRAYAAPKDGPDGYLEFIAKTDGMLLGGTKVYIGNGNAGINGSQSGSGLVPLQFTVPPLPRNIPPGSYLIGGTNDYYADSNRQVWQVVNGVGVKTSYRVPEK